MSGVRHRGGRGNHLLDDSAGGQSAQSTTKRQRLGSAPLHVPAFYWYLVCVTCALLLWVSMVCHNYVPPANTDLQKTDQFSEARARLFLDRLAELGPKPSGSEVLEVHAANIVWNEINRIQAAAKPVHHVEVDRQRPSGCYNLMHFDDFTLCYKHVLNIVVRLGAGPEPSQHALLVNCHFDSWPDSPGASDDGVSCAIMMETLYLLTQKDEPLPNDIIFLFNGAEENMLMAADGFITKHKWRHGVRAFYNLEACGSGGRELLFQAGPGNAWLLNAYLSSAPRPHCSVMGQEVFETGIVPGVTDFAIFRDEGKLSGLDVAYVRNGYVYHTEFDVPKFITAGSVQRAGENTYETVVAIASSPYLAHPGDSTAGRSVFFDVLGLFVVVYPYEVGVIINYIVLAFVAARVLYNIAMHQSETSFGNKYSLYYYSYGQLGACIAVQYAVWLAMLLTMLACSALIQAIDATLFWYASPSLVIVAYQLPMLLVWLTGHQLYAQHSAKSFHNNGVQEACVYDAQLCVNGVTLFMYSSLGFASAFFWMITTAAPLMRIPVTWAVQKLTGGALRSGLRLLLHWLCVLPAAVMVVYFTALLIDLFIPIMGRSLAANSEWIVGGLAFLGSIGIGLCFSSLIYATARGTIRQLQVLLAIIIAVSYVLLSVKLIGEPYHWDPEAPRLRRLHLNHAVRRHLSADGDELSNEAGVMYVPFDHRGLNDLPDETELNHCQHPVNCTRHLGKYCDAPYFIAAACVIPSNYICWLPTTDAPSFPHATHMQLVNQTRLSDGRHQLQFSAHGSDHMSLQVTPLPGWQLDSWSFEADVLHRRDTSFVYMAYGQTPDNGRHDWEFSITLAPYTPETAGVHKVHVSIYSHYVHGPDQRSARLTRVLDQVLANRPSGDWHWAITGSAWNIEQLVVDY